MRPGPEFVTDDGGRAASTEVTAKLSHAQSKLTELIHLYRSLLYESQRKRDTDMIERRRRRKQEERHKREIQ